MIQISIHAHAVQDIEQLFISDGRAAVAVLTALEQVKADPRVALDKLTTYGNNHVGGSRLNVKQWRAMRDTANLWRFRILDTLATSYRVLYGYHVQTKQLCIFAVVHKDNFDYDDLNSDLAKRIKKDWADL